MEPTYKSGRGLAVATVVLLTVMTGLMLAQTAVLELTMAQRGTFEAAGADMRLAMLGVLGTFTGAVRLAVIVVFLMWVYRATANLPALGSMSTRFTPAGAVWGFIIPFVNLVRSYQVMAMIWTESQPPALTDGTYLKPRSVGIVIAWYALWFGGSIVGSITSVVLASVGALAVAQAASVVFEAAAAILCAIMVYKADARQQAQADDLDRRANVPQPTGMELR